MSIITGQGGLPLVHVETPWSMAEVYLQGATVTHFQVHGQPPLLFLSGKSRFETGKPIRGGIPIVFPWFGKPADRDVQHGFARNRQWEMVELKKHADGTVVVQLRLPASPDLPAVTVDYVVTVGQTLTTELVVTNFSESDFPFENCLHTYFAVGDIQQVSIRGLRGVQYLDALDNRAQKTEIEEAIQFSGEVDRIYLDTTGRVEILDHAQQRVILVEKRNSQSTVVWNPWITKSQLMADFGAEEYQQMVCVESGNVAENGLVLPPGEEVHLDLQLSTYPMEG